MSEPTKQTQHFNVYKGTTTEHAPDGSWYRPDVIPGLEVVAVFGSKIARRVSVKVPYDVDGLRTLCLRDVTEFVTSQDE